jgi:hypothetical protein
MRQTLVVAVAITALAALTAPAAAQVERHCESVTAGKWRATNVSAFNMGCKSVRAKLRRWLGRNQLPRNPDGWSCNRSGVPGKNRQCITYQPGDPIGFSWLQQRR